MVARVLIINGGGLLQSLISEAWQEVVTPRPSRQFNLMGEANRKNRAHAALLAKQPWCVYCGGEVPATTIDHMPPRMMFRGKSRPNGLEFAACDNCNQATKHADLVASLLGRIYPDTGLPSDQLDIKKRLSAAGNNIPGLLQEMLVGTAGQKLAKKLLPTTIKKHPCLASGWSACLELFELVRRKTWICNSF